MLKLFLLTVTCCWSVILSSQELSGEKCGPLPPCAPPPEGCTSVFVRDQNDCITGCRLNCSCKEENQVCPDTCVNGYLADEHGCKTCQCRCSPSLTCIDECYNGYIKDADGCPTCTCALGLECHKWMKCSTGVCPYACSCQPNC